MRKLELITEGTSGGSSTTETYQRINFDSSNLDYIDLGNTVVNGCRTIEFWYKPSINITSSTTGNTILSRFVSGNADRIDAWFLYGKFTFQFRNSSGSLLASISSNSNSWTAGTEYHFVVKMASSGTKMYIDGVLQTETSTNTTPIPTSAVKLYLGGLHDVGIRYINGSIRNLQFWSIGRTVSEIAIDKDTYYPAGTTGLIETYHFTDETGFTASGVNGNNGTIYTSNASGVTYVDNTMREQFTITTGSGGGTNGSSEVLDLYKGENISVIRSGINTKNISKVIGGVTNTFKLPLSPRNNKIFDLLNNDNNTSEFPYTENYVRYTEDSLELIPKGRLNIKGVTNSYDVSIAHGINDFFDKIKGKFLYEAYEPYQGTILSVDGADIANSNAFGFGTDSLDSVGMLIPIMDTGDLNPIKAWQQIPNFHIPFGLEKICDHAGYTLVNNGDSLDNYMISGQRGIDITDIDKKFKGDLVLAETEQITVFSYTSEKKGSVAITFNTSVTQLTGSGGSARAFVKVNGVVTLTGVSNTAGLGGTEIFPSFNVNKGDLVECGFEDGTGSWSSGATLNVNYDTSQYFQTGNSLLDYSYVLGDFSQIDFIKNLMQLFNLGIEVDSYRKTVTINSNRHSQGIDDNIHSDKIDLTKYFSNVIDKSFNSDYGQINNLKYKYLEDEVNYADGVIIANNQSKEKDLIQSDFNASSNSSSFSMGGVSYQITTIKNSFDDSGKPNNIGFRINKLIREEQAGAGSTIPMEDLSGLTYNYVGSLSVLDFTGLDFNSLVNSNYLPLQNNILNRYQEYKVVMNTPKILNRTFNFKDRIIIKQLGLFVVTKITTKPSGLSEWELIKINGN